MKLQTTTKTAPKAKPVAPRAVLKKPDHKISAKDDAILHQVAADIVARTAAKAKPVSGMALVAGTAVKITHRFLKGAVRYHAAKGSLAVKPDGSVVLTQQGADLWNKDRVAKAPEKFAEIAKWMKHGGECPPEFKGQPATAAAEGVKFPAILYWGSFVTTEMRAAFAAIWAK